MQQLSNIFTPTFNRIDEKKRLTNNKFTTPPPAHLFQFSPSNGPSPTSVINLHEPNFCHQLMHEVRLNNFQDDFLPTPDELKFNYSRNKMIYEKRWFRYLLFLISLILLLTVSIYAISHHSSRQEEAAGAASNTTTTTNIGYVGPLVFPSITSRLHETITILSDDINPELLTDLKSPQFLAAQWMADIDMRKVSLNTSSVFKQRYALVLLWFATAGEYWHQSLIFLTDDHECDWNVPSYQGLDGSVLDMGVQCNTFKEVTGLVLQGMNLTGIIPLEIRILSKLEQVSLDHNNITDFESFRHLTNLNKLTVGYNKFLTRRIPEWIGELSNLQTLSLSASGIVSTLPTQLKQLTELSTLAMDNNKMKGMLDVLEDMPWLVNVYLGNNIFTGTITDTFLQSLQIIEVLDLSNNQLRGSLESAFLEHRPRLHFLDLHNNFLDGPLPDMPRSSSLKFLDLQNNLFNSSLPNSIDNLLALRHFDIANNRLTGDIPIEHLNKLTQLEYLSFYSNHLLKPGPIPDLRMLSNLKEFNMMNTARTGILPSWLGNLTKLVLLDLKTNRLNSTIPSELSYLSDLEFLLLNDNHLNGNIPEELGNMSKLEILLLDQNDLTGQTDTLCNLKEKIVIIADCETELSCECCSECCSDDNPKKCYDTGWLSFHGPEWEDHYSRNVFHYEEHPRNLP